MSIPHDCECSECEDLRAELARLQAEPMHKLLSRMKERAEKAESLLAKCREALDMIATLAQNDEDPRICKIALAGLGAFPATHEVAPKAQEVE